MKKYIFYLVCIVSVFLFNINADAATYAKEGESNFSSFQSKYENGITKTSIRSNGTVTIYGYSDCDSSGCTVSYSNQSSSVGFEKVLSQSVTCSNGEKNIKYTIGSNGGEGFQSDNKDKYVGKVYWNVDVDVTCTSESTSSTGDKVVTLDTSSSSGSSSSGSSTGSSSGSDYNSSTTTENPKQGVETYYVVLGIVGICSYVFMILVKKYNLFKKV